MIVVGLCDIIAVFCHAGEAKARAEERLKERAPGTDLNRAELALKRAVARIESVR